MEEISIKDLEYVKGENSFTDEEMNKFDGTRVAVDKIEVIKDKTSYDEKGTLMPEGQTRDVQVVVISTKPLKTNDVGKSICVSEKFNLKKHNTTGKWVASLHEKSKTFKLFKKYGVNSFPELMGREIVLSKKVRQNGTAYLGLSLG